MKRCEECVCVCVCTSSWLEWVVQSLPDLNPRCRCYQPCDWSVCGGTNCPLGEWQESIVAAHNSCLLILVVSAVVMSRSC